MSKTTKSVLSEDFLLQCSGCKELTDVKELSLIDMGLDTLPLELFEKLTSLEKLDVSENQLNEVPEDFKLPQLKCLNITKNSFSSITFVKNFPELEELFMDENDLTASDKLIAVHLCPKLTFINKFRATAARKLENSIKVRIKPKMEELWENQYREQFQKALASRLQDKLFDQFVADIHKETTTAVHEGLTKFADFVMKEFVDASKNLAASEPPKKKQKVTKDPEETSSPVKKNSNKDTNSDLDKEEKFTKISDRDSIKPLPSLPEYEPMLFIRCHSKDNDPLDCITKVWRAEFEPSVTKPGETTSIVATCGGDCLCLTDCNTGKLMKRYKQAGDQFYVIAWTTLDIESEGKCIPTNILATAGETGAIYLIHPAQCVCYAQLRKGGHHKEVGSLMFHPAEKTVLFSGASDNQIIMWDIGVPTFPDYIIDYRILRKFRSSGGDVLNMVISTDNGYIIAGCNAGCLAWNLNSDTQENQGKATSFARYTVRPPDVEISLSQGKKRLCDGLVQVSEDIVATKTVGEASIILWSISETLSRVKKGKTRVEPMARLRWNNTQEVYLNLGAYLGSGLLSCGGDDGDIWMYNVKHILKGKKKPTGELFEPSQVLSWPKCQLGVENEKDLKISDTLEKKERLIINGLGLNWNQEYMVAGTDNNLVCIWRKVPWQ